MNIMKKSGIIIIIIIMVLSFYSCKHETTESAIKYNDELVSYQRAVDNELVELMNEIDLGDAQTIANKHKEAKKALDDAIVKVKAMKDFDGKDRLKKAMLELLDMYKDVIYEDVPVLMEYAQNIDKLTDKQFNEYSEYYDKTLEKYKNAFVKFDKVQDEFAKEWNFTVQR